MLREIDRLLWFFSSCKYHVWIPSFCRMLFTARCDIGIQYLLWQMLVFPSFSPFFAVKDGDHQSQMTSDAKQIFSMWRTCFGFFFGSVKKRNFEGMLARASHRLGINRWFCKLWIWFIIHIWMINFPKEFSKRKKRRCPERLLYVSLSIF